MTVSDEYTPFLVPPGWTDSVYITNLTGHGGDFRLLFYEDGTVRFEHKCDRGERGLVVCAPALAPAYQIDRGLNQAQRNTITVSPPIHCPDCGTHGFVRNSYWVTA